MNEELATGSAGVLANYEVMRSFPKVELHRHLEGTFALATLHRMALRNGLDVPTDFELLPRARPVPRRFGAGLPEVPVSVPQHVVPLARRRDRDRSRLGRRDGERRHLLHRASVQPGALRRPQRVRPGRDDARGDRGRRYAAAASVGFDIRYLITFNRSKQTQDEMAELYRTLRDHRTRASSDSISPVTSSTIPPSSSPISFARYATTVSIRSTIHAGEVTPSWQIWSAIEDLGADRIGHGVAAITTKSCRPTCRPRDRARAVHHIELPDRILGR